MKVKFHKSRSHRKNVRSQLPVVSDEHCDFDTITPGIHFYPTFSHTIHLPVKEVRFLTLGEQPNSLFFDFCSGEVHFFHSEYASAGILFRCGHQVLDLDSRAKPFRSLFNGQGDFLAWADKDTIIASDWVHYPSHLNLCLSLLRQVYEVLGKTFPQILDSFDEFSTVKVLFGADPEFELLDNGWVSNGSGIIRSNRYGRIGLDSAGDQLEVRPDPCADPKELYRRIKALAIEAETTYNHRVSLAGHSYPIGCHIHVGPSQQKSVIDEDDVPQLVNQIDNALGDLIELSGRARHSYKERCAYECKEHGGFEYRSLPSCVLVTEKLFVAVMNVLKATLFEEPVPRLPEDELKRLTILVASGLPFTFDYEVIAPQFKLGEGDRYSDEFKTLLKTKTQKFAEEGLVLQDRYSLLGFGAVRGLVTNNRLLAKRLGWEYMGWSQGTIGLPYKVRAQFTGAELEAFFDTFFDVLVKTDHFQKG